MENDILKQTINNLQQIIDNTSVCINEVIDGGYGFYINNDCYQQININKLQLIHRSDNTNRRIIFNRIKTFYKLASLTISQNYNLRDFTTWSNESLTELVLDLENNHLSNEFTSIKGIENFPNLKTLRISGATQLRDVPTILNSVEHKINKLVFIGCSAINVVELQTHCQTKGINLEIS